MTYLPTMAATAWYHGKIKDRPQSLASFLAEARAFAVDEYAPALFKGSGLDRRRARAESGSAWPASPASPRNTSSAPTCASPRAAS